MDMNLISSENYFKGYSSPQQAPVSKISNPGHIYRALPAKGASSQQEGSSEGGMESGARQRKRTKRETKSTEDLDKSHTRGRPRLDPQDQTAAERRRTQIRLAQRAYRQRKETTISGLSDRASELEGIIDEMNQAFCNFNDTAISEGFVSLQPSLGKHLATTKETFLRLSRNANIGSDATRAAVGKESITPDTANGSFLIRDELRVDASTDHPSLSSSCLSESPHQTSISTFGLTLDASSDDGMEIMRNGGSNAAQETHWNGQSQPDWMTSGLLERYNAQTPDYSLANLYASTFPQKFIRPPETYSYQESTFARRLLRMSLENALRLLKDPRTPPSKLKYKFKFTFCFSSRAALISRIHERLAKSNTESLEAWYSPRLHIGGSGLHYPRSGFDDNTTPPPDAWWSEPIGPRPWQNPEDLSYKDQNIVECIKQSGLDGEWFDANDVEQYLRTKGVFLDSGSSYAEVPLPAVSSSQVSNVNSPGLARVDNFGDSSVPIELTSGNPQKRDFSWTDDITPFIDGPISTTGPSYDNFNQPDSKDFDFYQPLQDDSYADNFTSTTSTVRRATLDVKRFLNAMLDHSACLGRAPGYRRHAVDSALNMALLEAF